MDIIYSICFSVILTYLVVHNMLSEKLSRKYEITLLVYLMTISILESIWFQNRWSAIIMLAGTLIIITIGGKKRLTNVICVLTGYACAVALNSLLLNFVETVWGWDYETILNNNYLLFNMLNLTIAYLCTKMLGWCINKKWRINELNGSKKEFFYIGIQCLLCTLLFVCYILGGEMAGFDKKVIEFGGLLCTGYFLVTLLTTSFMIKGMQKTGQTEKILEQYRTIADYEGNKISELRQFRHDYLNLCSSMEGYIEEGDLEGLKTYFKEELNLMRTEIGKNTFNYGMIKKIKIPEICGLFYEKIAEAYEKKLRVTVNIENELVELNMKPVHFIRIAGVWLDNAIEAAEDSEEREIGILIVQNEKNLTVKIWNSYRGKIELGRIQEEGYSTKGEGRGLGLAGARRIASKYPNIYTETKVKEGLFIQSIQM